MIELAEKQEQAVDELPWPVRACQREAPAATGQSLVGPDLAGWRIAGTDEEADDSEEKAVEHLVETDERLPDIVLDDGEFRLNGREIFVHGPLRVISKDIAAKMPWIQLS